MERAPEFNWTYAIIDTKALVDLLITTVVNPKAVVSRGLPLHTLSYSMKVCYSIKTFAYAVIDTKALVGGGILYANDELKEVIQ